MQRSRRETVTLDDIVITEELSRRSPRTPYLLLENQALHTLARQLVNQPETMLQNLVDMALNLCCAGTAGVSLLETTPSGEEVFRWNVLAGALAQYVGGTTPRKESPCGVCLDRGVPVLFSHPERYFTYFQAANTPIVEGLVLPLIADNHALGSIWIMSHDEQRHFDAEDVRVMTSLADFTAAALLLNQRQTQELLAVNAALEAEILERKQAEERSRALIENLPGGAAFVVDRDLCYLLAEGEALSAAGFKPEDLVGQTIFEVLPPELVANYEVLYRKALAGESFEHEHNAHDRTYISRGTPLRSPNGEIYAVLAVSYDISDRKQAEVALRESEKEYRTLFNSIDEGFCIIEVLYDANGRPVDHRIVRTNPAFEKQSGLKSPDGKTASELMPGVEQYWNDLYAQVIETGESVRIEYRSEAFDRWFDVLVSRIGDAVTRQVAVVFTDITDRKKTEESLRESEEKYRSLFSSMDEGYFLCDVIFDENDLPIDILYLDANRAAIAMIGQDLTGRRLREINPNYESYWYEIFGRVALTGEGVRLERYAEPDDKWYDFYVVKVSEDNSHQVAVIFQDITDRKQNEKSLRESEAQIAADLAGMRRLYELQSKLADQNDVKAALQDVLAVACEFTGTDRGCVQLLSGDGVRLEMAVWQGYADDGPFISFFRYEGLRTGCEVARVHRQRMIIEDTVGFPGLEGTEAGAASHAEGIRASQSTPMASRSGETIGVISTQFRQPHRSSDHELRLMDMLAWTAGEFLERHRADAALRQSEQRFRLMADAVPQIVWLTDAEGRVEFFNKQWSDYTGVPYEPTTAAQVSASFVHPDDGAATMAAFTEARATGGTFLVEHRLRSKAGDYRWFLVRAEPYRDSNTGEIIRWFGASVDIHDRKQAEEQLQRAAELDAFRVRLADALRPLSDFVQIQTTACRLLCEHLDAQRVNYANIEGDEFIVRCSYTRGVAPITGRGSIATYSHALLEEYRQHGAIVVNDVAADPRFDERDRANYAKSDIAASASVMLIKADRWVASFAAHSSTPRQWTADELVLVRETAERIWVTVDRASAEEALRESEAKYRTLFNSIDEGYYLLEVIFDERKEATDVLFLDANPAAIRMSGGDRRGKRLREVGNYEAYWYELYGRVARTGVSERTEQFSGPAGIWVDTYTFKVGEEGNRVAAIFKDVTERKRREANQAFLAEIADEMSRLSTAEEIMTTVGAKIGAYLKVKSCLFVDVDDARGEVTVFDAWNTADVPSLRYQTIRLADFINEEFSRANRAGEGVIVRDTHTDPRGEGKDYTVLGLGAFVTVPFHRNGVWTNYLAVTDSQPRDWRDDEIELFHELSNRIFPRLDRARAEDALRQSEVKYRSLFTSIDEGYALCEVMYDENERPVDVQYLEVNPAFEQLSGLEGVVGKTAVELNLTVESFWLETIDRVVQTGEATRVEDYVEGLNRWLDVYFSRLDGEGSRQIAIVFNNITDRKRTEAQLRRVAELDAFRVSLSDALRSLSDPAAIQGEACRLLGEQLGVDRAYYTEINETEGWAQIEQDYFRGDSSSLAGILPVSAYSWVLPVYHRDEMLIVADTASSDLVPESDQNAMSAIRVIAVAAIPLVKKGVLVGAFAVTESEPREWTDIEIELTRETGERIWAAIERARAEDALRESEVKYRSLFESINDGFCVIEMIFDQNEKPIDYRFVEISPSFERQTGMVNALGKRMRELAPDHEEFWFETYGNVALTGQAVRFENRAGQLHRWFDIYAFPVGEPENRQVAIVFNDITDRKQAEADQIQRIQEQAAYEEERQRAETLAELDRAKTIFFSNVSHEFRTPLTLLLAPLQDALSDRANPLAPSQRERLELAHRNANRLLKLVNTLLDFSRIEAGRMEAVYEPTDLALLTTELASVFRSAIEQAGLRLIVDCPPLPKPVYVDRSMWEKIVLNLLSNAFKFTFEGEIAVRLHPADGNRVMLQIGDTGTGIPPEELPHLFERFYQVRGAASRNHEGSGIGLALVQELIRMHGGSVGVSSVVGQGTCFTVTIPFGTAHLKRDRITTRTLTSTALGAAPYVEEAQQWLAAFGGEPSFSILSSELNSESSTQNSKLFTRNSHVLLVTMLICAIT